MVGWKKVVCDDGNQVILQLLICNKKLKVPLNDGENIAKEALVMRIYGSDGYPTDLPKARSVWQRSFSYIVGKIAKPANGKKGGIWFWKSKQQAIDYVSTTKYEWYKKGEL